MRTKNLELLYSVDMGTVTGSMPIVIIEMNTHGGIDKVTVEMAGHQYPAYLWRGEEVEEEVESGE